MKLFQQGQRNSMPIGLWWISGRHITFLQWTAFFSIMRVPEEVSKYTNWKENFSFEQQKVVGIFCICSIIWKLLPLLCTITNVRCSKWRNVNLALIAYQVYGVLKNLLWKTVHICLCLLVDLTKRAFHVSIRKFPYKHKEEVK